MARKNDYIREVDEFIGNKIYSLRLAKGLSRQQLAELIGVTHQQLQKYEKGTNRISVGRLALIAKALAESISYFYEGLGGAASTKAAATPRQRMCVEAARNFREIASAEHQNAINALIRTLVKKVPCTN